MWYLVGGLFFLGVFAATVGVLSDRRRRRAVERGETLSGDEVVAPAGCCGRHDVCESDSLIATAGRPVEYFDDEELDAYRGLPSDAYPEDTVDEFREVLYTLKAAEVTGWIRSLQLRGIHLPDTLKDEALLIAGERRL
ncbi:MAG: phospholipase [Tannerella sp.]|jgi:hypothetical protein|nr:phospholipase [Tannerella sp.]